jgi:hypothetical protein
MMPVMSMMNINSIPLRFFFFFHNADFQEIHPNKGYAQVTSRGLLRVLACKEKITTFTDHLILRRRLVLVICNVHISL